MFHYIYCSAALVPNLTIFKTFITSSGFPFSLDLFTHFGCRSFKKFQFQPEQYWKKFLPHFKFSPVFTSVVPVMSSAQLCHWGHRSLSWNVVSLDVQQQCSWLNQNPMRQIPSFRSVNQWAAMSMPPARAPGREEEEELRMKMTRHSAIGKSN